MDLMVNILIWLYSLISFHDKTYTVVPYKQGVELQAYINQSQYSACRKEGNSSTLVEVRSCSLYMHVQV